MAVAADAAETDREAAVEGRDRQDLQSLTVAAAVETRDRQDLRSLTAAVEIPDRQDLQSLTVAAAVASRDLPDPFFREIQAVAVETE